MTDVAKHTFLETYNDTENGTYNQATARLGDSAGAPAGTTWKSFLDPLISPTGKETVFAAYIKGTGVTTANDRGIWRIKEDDTGFVFTTVAREGDEPPSAPTGAKWKTFYYLAFPGGGYGPLFVAGMQKATRTVPAPGGITSLDDIGLYGTDSSGGLRELIRENQPLLGKTVKSFNVIKAVTGCSGSSRSFNSHGQVVVLVAYTDKTTAIVRIDVP